MKRLHELPEHIKGLMGIDALTDIITNKSKTIEREGRLFHLLPFFPFNTANFLLQPVKNTTLFWTDRFSNRTEPTEQQS